MFGFISAWALVAQVFESEQDGGEPHTLEVRVVFGSRRVAMLYREFVNRYPRFRGRRVHLAYFDICQLFELRVANPEMSKSELARKTGISRPTVWRLLRIQEDG